jgi:excisionase family DNA binding protein
MAVNEVAVEMSEARRIESGAWRADSLCKKHPTHWWFAGGAHETVLAKSICSSCSVSDQCLEFALGRPEILGVWASTTPNERAALRRARRAPVVEVDVNVDVDLTTEIAAPAAPIAAAMRYTEPIVMEPIDRQPVVRLAMERVLDAEGDSDRAPRRSSGRGPARPVGPGERNDLLTPAEAARKLGVTPNTVTRWSRAGKISAIQTMGGHRRFRRAEIERVLSEANLLAAGLPPRLAASDDR